jgi:hypothetical protein
MPSRSTGPCIIFRWAGPSGLGQPKSSRKGIGVNTLTIEVGNEFLGWHSHELGVEAGHGGEVGIVCQSSFGEGLIAALGARSVAMGSRARGYQASLVAVMGSTLNLSSAGSGGGSDSNGARGAMRLALGFASTMEWRWWL